MNTSLRDLAFTALETAKADLQRDKYLVPVALVVTDAEIQDIALDFENAEQKAAVYSELVGVAKQKGATAIITINDASIRSPVKPHLEPNAGEVATRAQECIYLTVSGPDVQTWTISLPYYRVGNEIVYGSPDETFDDILTLLPGWPKEHPHIS